MGIPKNYDTVVIGAGIVGLATAWAIAQQSPAASICIIEKEGGTAAHQTGNNSGVLHSGIYYAPGSSKALNCTEGYGLMLEFLREYKLPYELCGKVIVATKKEELPGLQLIYERGIANGLKGLSIVDGEGLRSIEPHAAGLRAIHVPQSGITDYAAVCRQLQALLEDRGAQFMFERAVVGLQQQRNAVKINLKGGSTVEAGRVVVCAGLYSDRLAALDLELEYQIVPFRGEYYDVLQHARHLVRGLIYPVPDPRFPFLGVHFTKTVHGGLESGPNAVLAFRREGYRKSDVHLGELTEALRYRGFQALARKHWLAGSREFYRSLSKRAYVKSLQQLVPSIRASDVVPGGAGVRAQAVKADGSMVDDFLILRKGLVTHVCNAPSPAATASLAIGREIARGL